MPNSLTLKISDKAGVNLAKVFSDLADGLFSTSAAGTEFGPSGTARLSDGDTVELRVAYRTKDDIVHVTGLAGWDEGVAAFTATFETPEPLDFSIWTDMKPLSFGAALLGDTQLKVLGNKGDDWASGFGFGDRFQLGNGNDAAAGRAGDDVLLGGRGNDLLIGGADDDVLNGGKGRDLLIVGTGDDTAAGGGGNDVLVFEGGANVARGGAGRDTFLFDSFSSSAGGSPDVLRTTVRDLESRDLLVFGGLGVSPDTIDPSSETLKDVANGSIDDFRWTQKAKSLVIEAGDAKVILRNTTAEQVDLDMILFTEQTAAEATALFDSGGSGGTLGTPPGGDPYLIITMENWTRVSDGTTRFDTYGGDILDFASTAGGNPTV